MAAIDKTYVTKQELFDAIDWAKKVGQVEMENGHMFRPLNFIWDMMKWMTLVILIGRTMNMYFGILQFGLIDGFGIIALLIL